MDDLIHKLQDKDDKKAYELSKQIAAASAAKQCLSALHEVALYQPKLCEIIKTVELR